MREKEFFNKVANEQGDFLNEVFNLLKEHHIRFCIVGGMAVNAYAEPVISLDVDVVVADEQLDELIDTLSKKFSIKKYSHSINVSSSSSDIRIQVQTNSRYQDFIPRSSEKNILGYNVPVASVEDVLRGKIWAFSDSTRRASKRQKDLTDIMRLIEAYPKLAYLLPDEIKKQILRASGTPPRP